MTETTKTNKTTIECDCGTHHLMVQSEIDIFEHEDGSPSQYQQEFYLAMFSYGNVVKKPNIWRRLVVAFKYLYKGTMFADQLCLSPKEAKKLEMFLKENIIFNIRRKTLKEFQVEELSNGYGHKHLVVITEEAVPDMEIGTIVIVPYAEGFKKPSRVLLEMHENGAPKLANEKFAIVNMYLYD